MDEPLLPGRARYPSLQDRAVFVTGGASGIGRSIVAHFCDQGSRVAFVDIDDAAAAATLAMIAGTGAVPPLYRHCDLRDVEALARTIDEVAGVLGTISVLVNNAANDDRHTLEQVTPGYFDDRIAVNLKHQLFAAQTVRRHMRQAGGGSIVNLSSITWNVASGDCVCYVTSKSAVTGLTRALATELGPEGIRVNSVSPGWVMTDRQLKLWVTPVDEREIDEHQVLRGRLQGGDIARMVLWLAADDSRMCSKQNFVVDGGWT
jgi:D-xylose 1-dehydrogenase